MHPDFYTGPRMVKPPVVYNAGLLRMRGAYIDTIVWWSLGQSAGQQLFYPPDVGGWDYTRWLNTATFRARWLMAAIVQGADTPTDSPERSRRSSSSGRSSTGATRRVSPQTTGLLAAFAKAQLERQNAAPPIVETAMRRDPSPPPPRASQTRDELTAAATATAPSSSAARSPRPAAACRGSSRGCRSRPGRG